VGEERAGRGSPRAFAARRAVVRGEAAWLGRRGRSLQVAGVVVEEEVAAAAA